MGRGATAGETLAHYRLKQRLGSGAMGDVWLAEDLRLHRPVALKMLKAKGADAEAAARLTDRPSSPVGPTRRTARR
jgi:serine/threonine protein kinase